jgi:hypothetical protein
MGRLVKISPEPGSLDKSAGMGIFVNKFLDPGIFDITLEVLVDTTSLITAWVIHWLDRGTTYAAATPKLAAVTFISHTNMQTTSA